MLQNRVCVAATIIVLTIFLFTGCSTTVEEVPLTGSAWQQTDLRALELPGPVEPAYDLVAAYVRQTPADIELRFDLLGSPDPYAYELILFLDFQPGGSAQYPWGETAAMEWDLAFRYPGRGRANAFSASGAPVAIRPRALRLEVQDAFIARFSKAELARFRSINAEEIRFMACIMPSGQSKPADTIGPFRFAGPKIETRAPLLIAFWDTLPSATPTQALRRWNGAHTGPFGQRHGLSVLIGAAKKTSVPIAVLDLKQNDRLAVLEALDGIDVVRKLNREHLLLIPDLAYGDPQTYTESLLLSSEAGTRFQLARSAFLYGSAPVDQLLNYQAAFARIEDDTHISQRESLRLIPLPEEESFDGQVDQQGLTIAARAALLRIALSNDPGELLVMGGSLPTSAWSDSLIADPSFSYISGHPWILPLGEEALLNLPTRPAQRGCEELLCNVPAETQQRAAIREALQESPPGLFNGLAWQTYLKLTEPVADDRQRALREGYLSQVWLLLSAARWEQNPVPISSCAEDLNKDGSVECVLASSGIFMIIQPQGARLVIAAAHQNDTYTQMIGPRSQMVTGLGDPLDWRPGSGAAADPQEIPGAFSDPMVSAQTYRFETAPNQISFTNPDDGSRKIFRLIENGVRVEMEPSQPVETQIPLLMLSSADWKPGWLSSFQSSRGSSNGDWIWGQAGGGPRLVVTIDRASSTQRDFSTSLPYLDKPEDPNRDYPSGAAIPFPMAVIDVTSEEDFSIQIVLAPTQ